MISNNGVIRIGRKGLKKFAFGDAEPFEVDVVVAFQQWVAIDNEFRQDVEGQGRRVPVSEVPAWHVAAQVFVKSLANNDGLELTVAEALDFLARLREQYDELVVFFQPKSLEKPDSPDTSVVGVRFSEEES